MTAARWGGTLRAQIEEDFREARRRARGVVVEQGEERRPPPLEAPVVDIDRARARRIVKRRTNG